MSEDSAELISPDDLRILQLMFELEHNPSRGQRRISPVPEFLITAATVPLLDASSIAERDSTHPKRRSVMGVFSNVPARLAMLRTLHYVQGTKPVNVIPLSAKLSDGRFVHVEHRQGSSPIPTSDGERVNVMFHEYTVFVDWCENLDVALRDAGYGGDLEAYNSVMEQFRRRTFRVYAGDSEQEALCGYSLTSSGIAAAKNRKEELSESTNKDARKKKRRKRATRTEPTAKQNEARRLRKDEHLSFRTIGKQLGVCHRTARAWFLLADAYWKDEERKSRAAIAYQTQALPADEDDGLLLSEDGGHGKAHLRIRQKF
ncbi:MAG: hypothetical protein ABII12_15185 [Planctomycetota bacterium]